MLYGGDNGSGSVFIFWPVLGTGSTSINWMLDGKGSMMAPSGSSSLPMQFLMSAKHVSDKSSNRHLKKDEETLSLGGVPIQEISWVTCVFVFLFFLLLFFIFFFFEKFY